MKNPTAFWVLSLLALHAAAEAADRLVLLGASYGKNVLAVCEADGTVLWKQQTAGPAKGHAGHHDIHLLPSGNILYHDSWTLTREINLARQVVWEYDSASRNGNTGKAVDVHAFTRLPDGSTMIAESGVGRIIQVHASGELQHSLPLADGGRAHTRLVRLLADGHYLACAENPGVVTEYDATGKVVWEYPTGTRVYGAIRLRNGNTLIATGSGHGVLEVSPAKETVWEIRETVPGTPIKLAWTTMLQELPNGNRVIGNCHAGEGQPQIFEITRDKKVVWQFDAWDLVGNGLACWEILEGEKAALVRSKLTTAP
ncbi:MAG: PQQ-binding-like beta-propeller repeat protein [Verrucomicrobia bacterium]|nr:PQQ-binding-like beta-propeller repeat protein [Verrucomicrobiota bacterium]